MGEDSTSAPKLAKRSAHRKSQIMSGRTIGAKREHLETANERAAARKKDKQKSALRIFFTVLGFLALAAILVALYFVFIKQDDVNYDDYVATTTTKEPTIEIIDEDSSSTGGKITSRMKQYLGRVEECFKEREYQPVKAVIPASSIREVHLYLEGYDGFIKMIIDRDPAISVEDADRMIRYLAEQGTTTFSYIDVRIDGKAYWQ